MQPTAFALNLRRARQERRLSQEKFAELVNGFTQGKISALERGLQPSPHDVAALAAALGVTTETLLRSRPRRQLRVHQEVQP